MQISRLLNASSHVLALSSLIAGCSGPEGRPESTDSNGTIDGPTSAEEGGEQAAATSILILVEDEDGRPIKGAKIITRVKSQDPGSEPVPALPETPRNRNPGAEQVSTPGSQPLHDEGERVVAALTNSEGLALLVDLEQGVFTFEVRQTGFSSAVGQAALGSNTAISRRVRLQRAKAIHFIAEDGLPPVVHDGATIEVAPGALVYAEGVRDEPDPSNPGAVITRQLKGQRVVGEVQAELAVVHPRNSDIATLPGPMFGTSEDGTAGALLVSAGMLEFRMSQGGVAVQPAPGAGVKISLKVEEQDVDPAIATAVAEGKAIPKWYLDPYRGRWIEEGIWTSVTTDDGGLVLTATQEHFTWINVDIPGTPYCHRLRVLDKHGQPMADELVQIVEAPWHSDKTGLDGTVCMEGPGIVHVKVCGQEIALEPNKPDPQIVSACTDGLMNLGLQLNGFFGYPPFLGPYDDANCPFHDVYCEGQVCIPNDWQYCDPNDNDPEVGTCQNSKQICIDGTHWSACSEKVVPQAEVCDQDPALDDDCDGQVDNGCGCADMEERPCYPGSLDQLGFPNAVCKAGTQVCTAPDWDDDACVGYTLPGIEDCSTKNVDENCDGTLACFGDAAWATEAEEAPTPLRGAAIAVSSDGGLIVAGINAETGGAPALPVLCDPQNLITSLETDGLLVKYDGAQGQCSQVRRIGGPGSSQITDVAITTDNHLFVVGHFNDFLEEDEDQPAMCGPIVGEADKDHLFLAKYDANLTCLWRHPITMGALGAASNASIVLSPNDDDVFVAATLAGEIQFVNTDLNPSMIASSVGNQDGLVLEAKISGNPADFGKVTAFAGISSATGQGDQIPTDIAVTANYLAVAGYFTDQLEQSDVADEQEWFLRRYTLDGMGQLQNVVPSDYYPSVALPGNQQATAVAFSADGLLILGGFSDGKSTGIPQCNIQGEDDALAHGFVAFDLQLVQGAPQSTACGRVYGQGYETVLDLAVIDPGPDVVGIGDTVNSQSAKPVHVDIVDINGTVVSKCVYEDEFLLDELQATDGLAFRLSFNPYACQWVQRMPELLTGNKPFQIDDGGSKQEVKKIATDLGGSSFLVGSFKQGMGFASESGPPINRTGGPEFRAIVAKLDP